MKTIEKIIYVNSSQATLLKIFNNLSTYIYQIQNLGCNYFRDYLLERGLVSKPG